MTNNIKDYLILGKEVEEAIANNKPLVALETTIITHGMPYPENIETALAVEQIIRDNGAVPATIAIIDGVIRVGLTKDEIIALANKQGVVKASRLDLPVILAKKMSGATTVAGTMLIAKLAGIKIFVTGGIGGVHRGAEETMDISADLIELANTDVAVVCAGAKSILDIGLTLEYLETHGVPVLGLRTVNFPAFYTRDSGFKADYLINNEKEMAKVIDIKWRMGLKGGIVVANPIPEDYALPNEFINDSINIALAELKSLQISGKEVTPFLLAKLDKLTASKSLQANIELVKHNAYVGAIIAVEYNSILHD